MKNSNAGRIKIVSTIVIDPVQCYVNIVAQCLIAWSYVYASTNLVSPIAQDEVNCFLNKHMFSILSLPHLTMWVLNFIYYVVSKF